MTLNEAKALVLQEGASAGGSPDAAVFMRLHERHGLDHAHMRQLVQAIDTIHGALGEEGPLDRRLSGALWILGTSSFESMGGGGSSQEQEDIVCLFNAVEQLFLGFWIESPPAAGGPA